MRIVCVRACGVTSVVDFVSYLFASWKLVPPHSQVKPKATVKATAVAAAVAATSSSNSLKRAAPSVPPKQPVYNWVYNSTKASDGPHRMMCYQVPPDMASLLKLCCVSSNAVFRKGTGIQNETWERHPNGEIKGRPNPFNVIYGGWDKLKVDCLSCVCVDMCVWVWVWVAY
jgi:hypothetical protein